jgi:hypothetical protein
MDPIPVKGQHDFINMSAPLTLIGIYVAILRDRFMASTPSVPPLKWNWTSDLKTTGIYIEDGFNEAMEARNVRPGIWVDRDQTVFSKVVVGNQDQVPVTLTTGMLHYYCQATCDMMIECTSQERGESMMVGSIVHEFLHMSSYEIMKTFGIRDMSPVVMGKTTPFERDRAMMVTQIQFRVEYEARWVSLPIAHLLTGVKLKLGESADPEAFFRDLNLKG